jgi:hypothetical protein
MKSNADKSSDPLPLSYWLNWLMITLTSSLAGILTIICSQSLVAANLMFTLLYVMLMAPVEYKRWQKDGSGIRQLLEAWYAQTGCPMLLNTSLNIRGEPMVNDRADADRFEYEYGVKGICRDQVYSNLYDHW